MIKSIQAVIPKGIYCYSEARGRGRCPYWKHVESDKKGYTVRARCDLLDIEDEYPQDLSLLWDQVKLCRMNESFDDEPIGDDSKTLSLLFSGKAC